MEAKYGGCQAGGGANGELLTNRYKVPVPQDGVLETCCTTLSLQITILYCQSVKRVDLM